MHEHEKRFFEDVLGWCGLGFFGLIALRAMLCITGIWR
jgi:hypothetical protein